MSRTLQEVASKLDNFSDSVVGRDSRVLTNLTHDSRKVNSGSVFVCMKGLHADGHNFAADAVALGAEALIAERELAIGATVPVFIVPDPKAAAEKIAPWFYGDPGQSLRLIGVTGTNGKTTTTHIIREMLIRAEKRAGLLGTIHALVGNEILPMKNTTPDVIELQSLLAHMKTAEMSHVVMEVSSHALEQNRVFGCEFDTAVFSNITQDHLDFHGNFDNYRNAKSILFANLCKDDNHKQGKTAVVNIDDPAGLFMLGQTQAKKITYAVQRPADIRATGVKIAANGASFRMTGMMGDFSVATKLTGFFNVYNLMAAAGAAYAEGVPVDIIREVMETVSRVPGRFERVEINMPYDVIVDYAHTPDGLENVLKTAKEFVKGRLIVVFGCGGDRDRTKRPIMGRIATVYADRIIVTSDNPRSEDPEQIIAEIVAGIVEASDRLDYEAVSDRRAAIKLAMTIADDGDVILIAGKGHENYQILGDRTIHFDDCEVVREVLEEMK